MARRTSPSCSGSRSEDVSDRRAAFLRGDRPDDVAIFVADDYTDTTALAERGERVDGGVLLVLPGPDGRAVFERLTDLEPMQFAREAGRTEGQIHEDLSGGTCPESAEHTVQFILAFVQSETPSAGGKYAEGDVLHGYAACECGTAFSETRVLD